MSNFLPKKNRLPKGRRRFPQQLLQGRPRRRFSLAEEFATGVPETSGVPGIPKRPRGGWKNSH
jgi:hypothetical protein